MRVGSCSIIVMHDRKSFMLYSNMFLLSICISPCAGSNIRNRQLINVDLPAPVRPTIPTLSPGYI